MEEVTTVRIRVVGERRKAISDTVMHESKLMSLRVDHSYEGD